jgi:hypothetical protein
MCFTRYKLVLWALFAACLYVLLAYTVPAVTLIAILNGIFLGVAVAVTIVYAPLIWFSMFKFKFDRVSQLSVGIGLLWFSVIAQRFWSFLFRYKGSPEAWLNGYFISAIGFVSIIAGILFVTAPAYPPDPPIEPIDLWGGNRKLLIVLGLLGGISTFVLSIYPGIDF